MIEGNHIHHLGGGGITAGAILNRDTWKWADPVAPDDHKQYRIANNHVHDCGLDYFGAIGIFIGATQEVLVSHNLVHDTAYAGIVISGNETPLEFARNNIVEYNHLHHVQKMAVDGGGIYASFPHADRGIVIRRNLIHDITYNPVARGGVGGWSAPESTSTAHRAAWDARIICWKGTSSTACTRRCSCMDAEKARSRNGRTPLCKPGLRRRTFWRRFNPRPDWKRPIAAGFPRQMAGSSRSGLRMGSRSPGTVVVTRTSIQRIPIATPQD